MTLESEVENAANSNVTENNDDSITINVTNTNETVVKDSKTKTEVKIFNNILDKKRHIRFFLHHLRNPPGDYKSLDLSRLLVLYFCLGGLDILNSVDEVPNKDQIVDWVYSLQIIPDETNEFTGGFRGSPFAQIENENREILPDKRIMFDYDCAHIAMTYSALYILTILGDDLSRVNRDGIFAFLKQLQLPDGSFRATLSGSESSDLRFTYCACVISKLLKSWECVNTAKVKEYIKSCKTYDGVYSLIPGQESHGSPTYLAIASRYLIHHFFEESSESLNEEKMYFISDIERETIIKWCLNRQVCGFQGRVNKDPDTCYSFWVGSTLDMLDAWSFIDTISCENFIFANQHPIYGGFSKYPEFPPDILHSFYSLSFFSIFSRNLQEKANSNSSEKALTDFEIQKLKDFQIYDIQAMHPSTALLTKHENKSSEMI